MQLIIPYIKQNKYVWNVKLYRHSIPLTGVSYKIHLICIELTKVLSTGITKAIVVLIFPPLFYYTI